MLRRLALLLPAPVLLVALTAVPAQAEPGRCATNRAIERCASLVPAAEGAEVMTAVVEARGLRLRYSVLVRHVRLQHRTDAGWETVNGSSLDINASYRRHTQQVETPCAALERGTYRVRGTIRWLERGDDTRHRSTVATGGVRKGRLC